MPLPENPRPAGDPFNRVRLALVVALAATLLFVALFAGGLVEPALDMLERMDERTGNQPWLMISGFVVLFAFLVALGLPVGTILTIAAGFLFGLAAGVVASLLGGLLGSVITYAMARALSARRIRLLQNHRRFHRILNEIRADELLYLVLLRIVPVFPFALVNLALGLIPIRLFRFLLTTTLGLIPSMVVYAALGTSLDSIIDARDLPLSELLLQPRVLLPLTGLIALIGISLAVRFHLRRKR